jgi:hypothetical protein
MMQVQHDFPPICDEHRLYTFYGQRLERYRQNTAQWDAFQIALEEVNFLIHPAVIWDSFRIEKTLHNHFLLEGGTKIGGGPVVPVIGGATELILAVCTIGSQVEEAIHLHTQNNEPLEAVFLDEMSSWATDQLSQLLCHQLESDLSRRDLQSSTPLSPGISDWSLKDQGVIFGLLDTQQIGVTLNSSLLMHPIKSVSLIMGAGPVKMGKEGATSCDYCNMSETCAYRRKEEKGE